MANASITVTDTCGRCYGHVDAFRRYETLNGGRCFQCGGVGTVTVTFTPEEMESSDRVAMQNKQRERALLAEIAKLLRDAGRLSFAPVTAIASHLVSLKAINDNLFSRALPRAMCRLSAMDQKSVSQWIELFLDDSNKVAHEIVSRQFATLE